MVFISGAGIRKASLSLSPARVSQEQAILRNAATKRCSAKHAVVASVDDAATQIWMGAVCVRTYGTGPGLLVLVLYLSFGASEVVGRCNAFYLGARVDELRHFESCRLFAAAGKIGWSD